MENIRKAFPQLDSQVYVNTAASGLLSKGLLDWRRAHDLDFYREGGRSKMHAMVHVLEAARQTVAQFFTCPEANVSLVPNFSLGLNMLLEGCENSQRVLLLENDYPSVNWPFEQRGFPRDYVKITNHLEQDIHKALKKGNHSILALSVVQWLDGRQIDLDFLCSLKKEFPNLLIIADGTQYLGTKAFNFLSSGLDVLGASAYKWLLSGFGNGFFLFKDAAMERFKIPSIGFNSVAGDISKKEQISFPRRLEPGHLDTLSFGSLKYALEFLDEIGIHKIQEQNERLIKKARGHLMEMGLLPKTTGQPKDHGSILNIPGDEKRFKSLTDHNIICSQRGGGIRMSFHFYNSENDIDKIISALKTI